MANIKPKHITGNVGEWSEIYTLLKLLGEGRVFAGDQNLEKIKDLFYPIIMIIRQEKLDTYDYRVENSDIVIQTSRGKELLRLSSSIFLKQAESLLTAITDRPVGIRSFSLPETQAFMDRIHCYTLKAKSKDKTDIRIVLHDQRTRMNKEMGFSIKSELGADSTLLNASKATNFTYKVEGCQLTDEEISRINRIDSQSKINDRITEIERQGGHLVFDHVDNSAFQTNLVMLDGDLASVIAELLLANLKTGNRMFSELVTKLAEDNLLKFPKEDALTIYTYKLKHLLTSAALGMMPSKRWSGYFDANGGYLVVKEDGEILCYHFYDRNRFEDFIFAYAYLERASTTRHGYARLYKEGDGNVCFKLNLQIRLK